MIAHIEKLAEFFKRFPGIGPRQAKRFVYFLLSQEPAFLTQLEKTISEISENKTQCMLCNRYFIAGKNPKTPIRHCTICADENRDKTRLLIVEKDSDIDAVEKTRLYNGTYFVLGGTIPLFEKTPKKHISEEELVKRIGDPLLSEAIIALSANEEGDFTGEYVKKTITPLLKKKNITLSFLAKGFSTGTELEYSDTETLKNALKNRG